MDKFLLRPLRTHGWQNAVEGPRVSRRAAFDAAGRVTPYALSIEFMNIVQMTVGSWFGVPRERGTPNIQHIIFLFGHSLGKEISLMRLE